MSNVSKAKLVAKPAKAPTAKVIAKRIADYKAADAAPKPRQPKAAPAPTPVGKTRLAAALAKGLAEPRGRAPVVQLKRNATALAVSAANSRKPTQVQNKPGMVVGHPTTPLYKGKGATPRSIAALAPANKGHDTVAILNDGSTHPVTRMLAVGAKVAVGAVFSAVCADYAKLQAVEDAKRSAAPKGPAVLAKGAEGEVHSRKAAHDSRKGVTPAKAEKTKPTPKGAKNKAPSAGADFAYKPGKKAVEAKPDSWRLHMLSTIVAHKDTASAKAAHAKGKKFSDKKLDFSWALSQGYIAR